MDAPGSAARLPVLQKRLDSVHRIREAGFRGRGFIKFFPEAAQVSAKLVGQKAEDPVGSAPLALFFRGVSCPVKGERIPSVDFYHVMHDEHAENFCQIHGSRGVFLENHGRQGKMPGMLGGIFLPGGIRQQGAAKDILQFVGLNKKRELLFDALVNRLIDAGFWILPRAFGFCSLTRLGGNFHIECSTDR